MLFSLGTHRELFASEEHVAGEVAVADGSRPGHTGRRHRAGGACRRNLRRFGVVGCHQIRNDARVRRFCHRRACGRRRRDGLAFSGARQNRLDLSIGIALGSASQIALFVAPTLVLISYVIAPSPMDLQLWPGAVAMMLIATLTAFIVANGGRVGVGTSSACWS